MTLDEINERLAARNLLLTPAPAGLRKYRFFLVPREATVYPAGSGKGVIEGREPLAHFHTLEEASASLLESLGH